MTWNNWPSWRTEAGVIAKLAAPLALTQLAFMAMVSTDILMMGWLGSKQLATGTLAGHYFWLLEFFSMGLLTSVTPIISQHLGAQRHTSVRRTVRQAFWASAIIFVPCAIAAWWSGSVLVLFGQDPDIAMAGQAYIRVMLIGLLPGLWHIVLGETLAAHERPRPSLVIAVCAIFVNVLLNYALMFGHFGFPAMGLVGAGIGTSIVATLMFLTLLGFILCDKQMRKYRLFTHFWRSDWPQMFEIFKVGTPIALTEMSEIATIFVAALLMGWISVDALAAHGIVVQCIGLFLMVPVGFMQAASIRVGHSIGAGDVGQARHSGYVALSLNFLYILAPVTAVIIFGDQIVGLFLDVSDPQNIPSATIAKSILSVGALFLLADAMHLTARGALMGIKDTTVPMFFSFCAYGASLPAAWYLAIHHDFGPEAVWISLGIPLLVLAAALIWRFNLRVKNYAPIKSRRG